VQIYGVLKFFRERKVNRKGSFLRIRWGYALVSTHLCSFFVGGYTYIFIFIYVHIQLYQCIYISIYLCMYLIAAEREAVADVTRVVVQRKHRQAWHEPSKTTRNYTPTPHTHIYSLLFRLPAAQPKVRELHRQKTSSAQSMRVAQTKITAHTCALVHLYTHTHTYVLDSTLLDTTQCIHTNKYTLPYVCFAANNSVAVGKCARYWQFYERCQWWVVTSEHRQQSQFCW